MTESLQPCQRLHFIVKNADIQGSPIKLAKTNLAECLVKGRGHSPSHSHSLSRFPCILFIIAYLSTGQRPFSHYFGEIGSPRRGGNTGRLGAVLKCLYKLEIPLKLNLNSTHHLKYTLQLKSLLQVLYKKGKSILKFSNYLITMFLKLRSIYILTYLLMDSKYPQILIAVGSFLLKNQATLSFNQVSQVLFKSVVFQCMLMIPLDN